MPGGYQSTKLRIRQTLMIALKATILVVRPHKITGPKAGDPVASSWHGQSDQN